MGPPEVKTLLHGRGKNGSNEDAAYKMSLSIFSNSTTDRILISRIHNEIKNDKKLNYSINKGENEKTDCSQKITYKCSGKKSLVIREMQSKILLMFNLSLSEQQSLGI